MSTFLYHIKMWLEQVEESIKENKVINNLILRIVTGGRFFNCPKMLIEYWNQNRIAKAMRLVFNASLFGDLNKSIPFCSVQQT